MAPGRKRGEGCWTCRLRRKRCDAARPVCGSCQSLGITCHVGEATPSWMDGGLGQTQATRAIRLEVKQNSIRRKSRLHGDQDQIVFIATGPTSTSSSADAPAAASAGFDPFGEDGPNFIQPATSAASILPMSEHEPLHSLSSANDRSASHRLPLPNFFDSDRQSSPPSEAPGSISPAFPIQVQLGSVMIYLDHVFPFLFPFYQPPLMETGRQWLLGLLFQNETSFHIAASLSAYFFSLVPQSDGHEMAEECRAVVRKDLLEQMDLALRSTQNTLTIIETQGAQSGLLGRVRLMEEITQLLIVEATVRETSDWTIHLPPALILFEEIFKSYGTRSSKPCFLQLLDSLPKSNMMARQHHKPLPYTADQSALVFFVTVLLYIDILASTCLGAPPSLSSYHDSLLAADLGTTCPIRMEDVVGCQNWPLLAIAKISNLCAWEHNAKESGSFSVIDLVNSAQPISQALEDGLANLDSTFQHSSAKNKKAGKLRGYYTQQYKDEISGCIAKVTRIWAYAAKLYLEVSLSGWQTNSPGSQNTSAEILGLLQSIKSPAQLRALSWPITIAGCLAAPDQREAFRCLINELGQLYQFGTMQQSLQIITAFWGSKNTLQGGLAPCLSISGTPALLF